MQKRLRKVVLALGLLASLSLTACGSQNSDLQTRNDNGGTSAPDQPVPEPSADEKILEQYSHFDPQHAINTGLLKEATLYFHKHKSLFQNQKSLTIIDFSLHSSKKRFFIINVATGEVWSTYTAHGKGSDPGATLADTTGYARYFSNNPGSNMSSLGPYKTGSTYDGKHGYSLRLNGLASTNSNAYDRAIVVHGASYVHDEAVKQGRSEGCPALPLEYYSKVIDIIKGGSLIYAGLSANLQSAIAQND